MEKKLLLCLVFIFMAGCLLGSKSPVENIAIAVDMTVEDFLVVNGLFLEGATEFIDGNSDGNVDVYLWDLDRDKKSDIVIVFDEGISRGLHGTTMGFNKIVIYDYVKREVWVGEVGKASGKILTVRIESLL